MITLCISPGRKVWGGRGKEREGECECVLGAMRANKTGGCETERRRNLKPPSQSSSVEQKVNTFDREIQKI